MFRILVSIIKIIFFITLILLGYMTISDLFFFTDYFDKALVYVEYLRFIGFLSIAYFIILFLAIIERLFKKAKIIKTKSKNGKLEVQIETINDLTKNFLESKKLIIKSNVITQKYFSKIIINSDVETYSTENLNEKLLEIQNELKEYVLIMTGIEVREVVLKISKISSEKYVEKSNDDVISSNY